MDPSIPQFHSSLAFAYAKMGESVKARYEAEMFLRLMPEAKDEVDAFLKTRPQ
jgi:outer membrane protein assembly factor BamD (BamD/ComL family)